MHSDSYLLACFTCHQPELNKLLAIKCYSRRWQKLVVHYLLKIQDGEGSGRQIVDLDVSLDFASISRKLIASFFNHPNTRNATTEPFRRYYTRS